ncbi:hypothetical protein EOL70_15095 [Leucothrix sargassi]|nr:hypothetical protein EOL70_15095 [Leucothrix sargassi]
MSVYSPSLPTSRKVDIPTLSRMLENKRITNSYKYLFFLAILTKLEQKPYDRSAPISFTLQDLTTEMVLLAWYPIKYFQLSFGPLDQVATIIDKLIFDTSNKDVTSLVGREQLRNTIKAQSKKIGLGKLERYVPYLLQSVFFPNELKGERSDTKRNQIIQDCANAYSSPAVPLYSYTQINNLPSIDINTNWLEYFLTDGNITIVKEWAVGKWTGYLQKRNPNTPAIINKIFPPLKRSSLSKQTTFWQQVIDADQGQGLRCIYSNEPLIDQPFSLDHFLPWTFICHDQIWNLCPVTPSSNSSKGNKLPAEDYVEKFIQQQIHALEISSKVMSAKRWDKVTESYALDLHLDPKLLLDESAVRDAYTGVLMPMMTLAETSGFEGSWVYSSNL